MQKDVKMVGFQGTPWLEVSVVRQSSLRKRRFFENSLSWRTVSNDFAVVVVALSAVDGSIRIRRRRVKELGG